MTMYNIITYSYYVYLVISIEASNIHRRNENGTDYRRRHYL